MTKILGFDTHDVRFPTSRMLDGSDAMNPDPDYSAATLIAARPTRRTAWPGTRTCSRSAGATRSSSPRSGRSSRSWPGSTSTRSSSDLGGLARRLAGDSPLRWLGPERGVVHMAIGAVLNACWDLAARRAGKPLWLLLAELSPEEIVGAGRLPVPDRRAHPGRRAGTAGAAGPPGGTSGSRPCWTEGYPAYTTTPGWLGYSDDRLARLCAEAVQDGFTQVKLKVGARLDGRQAAPRDRPGDGGRGHRDRPGREPGVGRGRPRSPGCGSWRRAAPEWIEEPTSPDDILGTAAIRRAVHPVRVATGEHVSNRVIFKQLLQAGAIDVMQIDACRVGGVNENIANLLLAAKFGVPVCPHAGGVGLCEMVQHLAMFDYAAVSAADAGRQIEWIDHLHEHFTAPARVERGRYVAPTAPGGSAELRPESVKEFSYPEGSAWLSSIRGA